MLHKSVIYIAEYETMLKFRDFKQLYRFICDFLTIRLGSKALLVISPGLFTTHLCWVVNYNYASSSNNWHLFHQTFKPLVYKSKNPFDFRETFHKGKSKYARFRNLQSQVAALRWTKQVTEPAQVQGLRI